MAERIDPAVLNREVNFFVNKGTEAAPNWIMVGCGNSKDYGGAANLVTLNCDSGKKKVPDGEEPDYDMQLTGFVFEYAAADIATNVSRREFETWFKTVPQVLRSYRLAGKYTNDLVREFQAYIASFRETGSNGEARTYTIAFTIVGLPELSDQE
ncbi:hypothetical protein [Dyadobacter fermentans]|uniref:hypothetical protein n=1 Tax=Dyadobacter fermentans TaxID=94254 RepID=UPI001CBE3F10|nr:hypothetical protein [Dyadobacter fermentans]MBZ1362138.1 hypothetical protein [Dyadobacter fermentans]